VYGSAAGFLGGYLSTSPYKTAFYCIRGLLSADIAARQIIPELLIDNLFDQIDSDSEVL